TDKEIAEMTEHFLATTIKDLGRLRIVRPDTVIEVAFDQMQESARHDSGYAMRFPRIVRLRPDKPVSEIDTLDTVREIARTVAAEAARSGLVMRIDEPYEDPRFDPSTDQRTGFRTRSIIVAPIDSRDRRRLGVLQVLNHRGGAFDQADEDFARTLAGSAGVALEYVQLSDELAAERLRVVKVAEEERKRLARDLHDGVAQVLANAAIGIEI